MAINELQKKLLTLVTLPSAILLILFGTGRVNTAFFQFGMIVTLTITTGYWIYRKQKINEVVEDWEKKYAQDSVTQSVGLDEAMEILERWSEQHYTEKQKISFEFSNMIYQTTLEKDPMTEEEYYFYAFITLGENNRKTLIVLEGKNGEIVTHMPLLWDGMKRNPFEYCSMVKELRKNKFHKRRSSGAAGGDWRNIYDSQQAQGLPQQGMGRGQVAGAGGQMQNLQYMGQGNQQNSDDEDGEDEE